VRDRNAVALIEEETSGVENLSKSLIEIVHCELLPSQSPQVSAVTFIPILEGNNSKKT